MVGRSEENELRESDHWSERSPAVTCNPSRDAETGQTSGKAVHCIEQLRHAVLLMRLQKPYLAYCFLCSVLACTGFFSTMINLMNAHRQGVLKGRGWIDVLEGGTWQSTCWTVVGMSLVAEVASNSVLRRGGRCIGDWWCAFDAALVILTLVGWVLTHLPHTLMRSQAEEVELWLLLMRFVLQPCRVCATAVMARKVQQMQQNYMDVSFDTLSAITDVSATRTNSWMTADTRSGIGVIEPCTNKGQHVL